MKAYASKRRHSRALTTLLVLSLCVPCVAHADEGAEALLRRKEFVLARDQALAELATGERDAAELIPLYRVLAIASGSIAEQGEEARQAFVWLLALDPEFRLGAEWPVEVRSPYMEARGDVSAHPSVLSASGRLAADECALLVAMMDPFALAARLRLRVRNRGESQYVETVRVPEPEVAFSLPENPEHLGLEYTLSLLDEHGNRIWQQGSDEAPNVLPYASTTLPVVQAERESVEPLANRSGPSRGYYVGAAAALIATGAATVVGGIKHAERQRLADSWNDADCSGSGATRAEQCGQEREQIDQAQRAAGIAYGVAGVSLVTSALLFIAAASRHTNEDVRSASVGDRMRCASGPGKWGLSCTTAF